MDKVDEASTTADQNSDDTTPTAPEEGGVDNPGFVGEEENQNLSLKEFLDESKNNGNPEEPPPDYDTIEGDAGDGKQSGRKESVVSNLTVGSQNQLRPDGKPTTIWNKDRDPEEGDGGEGSGDRDVWDSPLEFLFSCISMSVGLGNVWRFPFAAYENGGGAFLIPYLVVLLVIGRPIYYLEMCLGQFSSYGQVKIWNMAPIFKGVGYGSMVGVICVVSYYCSIMGQTVFYFIASFSKELPWTVCDQSWGGEFCFENGTVDVTMTSKSVATLYYEMEAFPRKARIDDGLGTPDWRLALCLIFSWFVVFLSLVKGVKSSGKVAYFTAIFPYVVLLILLIRGVTLPGAADGILYFIKPQWDKIYDPKVWYAAVGQCFFSLGTGFGPVIMLSSYNPFRHNVYRDALIISFMDTFTSLLAGCTIFAVLGYLKQKMGVENISDVTSGGAGLAFVSYPEAIAQFDWVPQLFAVLFFLMLFALGIGSATSLTGGMITIICDQFPNWKRWLVTGIICACGTCMSVMYITPGGPFMVDFMDYFGAGFVIYVMAMVEVGAISWVYGLDNFCRDIEFMLGVKVGYYWKFCWGFLIPVGLFVILIYTLITQDEITSGGESYPQIVVICGWLVAAFAVCLIPAWGMHAIYTRKAKTFKEKFFEALKPTKHWGPKNPTIRKEWEEFKKYN